MQFAEEVCDLTILVWVSAFGLLYLVGYGIHLAVCAAFRLAKLQWQHDWQSHLGVGISFAVLTAAKWQPRPRFSGDYQPARDRGVHGRF